MAMRESEITAESGCRALRDHAADRANLARVRYGPITDAARLATLLNDREIVRHPVTIEFDARPLQPGELAHVERIGALPVDGFRIVVYPTLRDREDAWLAAALYQLVLVNYGEIASSEVAEVFGAVLLGLDIETYYRRLCALADGLVESGEGA